jgi:adenine-specific DNA-methyltransferase
MSSIIKDKVKAKEIDVIGKINGESLDIVKENVKKLKELFPEVFTEEKIDFDRLQDVLGNYIDDKDEKYRFEWHGKTKAIKISQTPSRGTLRPCREESKNFDDTENLYIEGDNLEVLKLLQKSYQGKIKMIYIDPPYNTGNDFIYPDNYSDNLQNYMDITGQIDGNGNKFSSNAESGGRYHTNWLNMMYSRLRLAKNLLQEEGILLIHIDEHEYCNCTKILEEIFGENNDIGDIVWDKRNPKGDSKGVACQHEYIKLFCKNKDVFLSTNKVQRSKKNAQIILEKAKLLFNKQESIDDVNNEFKKWINSQTNFSGGEKAYNSIDKDGNVYQAVSMAWPNKKKAPDSYFVPLIHPITGEKCPVPEKGWRNPPETMKKLLESDMIIFGKDESSQPRRKYLLKDNMCENLPSIIYNGGSDEKLLKELGIPFDTPKVVELTKELINIFVNNNSIVLDFFSGSSTTAHSIMQLNAEDGGSRKFIMVQLPEQCDEKSEAYKAGYKNICEIGKERIRRAGEKILQDYKGKEGIEDLDIGFKVFKLDTSNIKPWNPDYDNLVMTLEDTIDNFVPHRSEEDVIYEIMLKYGIDLTYPIDTKEIGEKKIFSIGFGALLICLDDDITLDEVNDIVKLKDELKPKTCRVVFKDNGFKTDSVKANAIETLRRNNIKEIMSI